MAEFERAGVTTRIDPDDWEAWRGHSVTEQLFKGFAFRAAEAKAAWLDASWNGGRTDATLLASLRARAEAFEQMMIMSKETLEDMDEPDSNT